MSSLRHLVKRGEETDDLQTAIKNTVLTGMELTVPGLEFLIVQFGAKFN